jgi:hypothetical protein
MKVDRKGDKCVVTFQDGSVSNFSNLSWCYPTKEGLCVEEYGSGPSGPWFYSGSVEFITDPPLYPSSKNKPLINLNSYDDTWKNLMEIEKEQNIR